jgi:hypothetical protein
MTTTDLTRSNLKTKAQINREVDFVIAETSYHVLAPSTVWHVCKHDTFRHSQTYPPDARVMTQRRMVWCEACGKLLSDDTWKIPPLPNTKVSDAEHSED